MTESITYQLRCRCGGLVIVNVADKIVSHEVPECEEFKAANEHARESFMSELGADRVLRRVPHD